MEKNKEREIEKNKDKMIDKEREIEMEMKWRRIRRGR